MVTDPISNLIISLKNASLQGIEEITVPYSKIKNNILEVLKKEGYISDFEKKGKDIKKKLKVELKYDSGSPKINDVKRLSKFSKRVYKGVNEIYPVKNGYGILVLSTPKGVISDRDARKQKVGGEALFEIW